MTGLNPFDTSIHKYWNNIFIKRELSKFCIIPIQGFKVSSTLNSDKKKKLQLTKRIWKGLKQSSHLLPHCNPSYISHRSCI